MALEKHNRSVELICVSCGSTQFQFEDAGEETAEMTCASCGRYYTKDELLDENAEIVGSHVEAMKKDILKSATSELRSNLKRALGKNKFTRFK